MSWRLIPFFTMISIVYGFGTLTNLQFSRLPIRVLRRAWSVKQLSSASSSESSGAVLDRSYSLCLSIPTSEDMEDVGALLSVLSNPPDVLFLDGDLGAGKTTFSRGFIQCKLGSDEEAIKVTSPTYLLCNTYGFKSARDDHLVDEIHHMDLYRLSGTSPNDFDPLHLDRVFTQYISLVEWPSRLFSFPELMPPPTNRLDINLSIVPSADERKITLTAPAGSTWKNRLGNLVEEGMIDDLLLNVYVDTGERPDETVTGAA